MFRGKTKNVTGEDMNDSILGDKETVKFITQKLVTYFGSPDVSGDRVDELAQSFFRSGYNIEKLVKDIFTSDWFFKKEFVGNRIKLPVELIIGIQLQTERKFSAVQRLLFFQRSL